MTAKAEELFDVVDEHGKPTGKAKPRSHVHRDGDWHRSVHIWLLDSETGRVVVQKRAKIKDTNPGKWDISCAGHLSSGETAQQACQKELGEELGIHVRDEDMDLFELVTTVKKAVTLHQRGKTILDNEFNDVYVIDRKFELKDMVLQESEVEEVKWMDLEEVCALAKKGDPLLTPFWNDQYALVFEFMRKRCAQVQAAAKDGAAAGSETKSASSSRVARKKQKTGEASAAATATSDHAAGAGAGAAAGGEESKQSGPASRKRKGAA